tara:strand:- start:1558 stop:1890 length:333 start_codon:yes stop_codon:yes gene_type:complete
MRILFVLVTVFGFESCKSVTQPNFLKMSDAELQAYNLQVSLSEQVNCLDVEVGVNMERERRRGTLDEIQKIIQLIAPGASVNSVRFFPLLNEKSRSTNPPLAPTNSRRPL